MSNRLKGGRVANVASPRKSKPSPRGNSSSSPYFSNDNAMVDEYHPSEPRGNNFKVVIRVRPPLPRELHGDRPFQNVVNVDSSGHFLTVSENLNPIPGTNDSDSVASLHGSHVFTFDHVYGQHCNQREVYEKTAKAVVESSLEGYNATLFAYGQTGTGKTYTMEGFNSAGSLEARGIIPRAIEQIFQHIEANVSARTRFLVRASYLQIYNESISDLLKPGRNNLAIREDKKRGVFVEGLSEWVVRTPAEIYGLMERGGAMRATGSTKMNEISSRSHAVFIIIAEQSQTTYINKAGQEISMEEFTQMVKSSRDDRASSSPSSNKYDSFVRQSFKVGKLNLVDLAGSERVRLSGATGQRLEESKNINQSLSALGNVISALTDSKGRQHIPYRDSKLTRILEDSLGGNCRTTMMAMISPALESMVESLSTLKFANRAKNIKNEARVNEDLDQKSLLRKYERELKRLRSELDKRSRNVVDKRRLLELDEQRRRAEQDKMAAIRALEERSLEFMQEKEEKRRLEKRIESLTSQMLMSSGQGDGSGDSHHNPQVRVALQEQQDSIRRQYEGRLAELEKERETIEEEKAQVDRYKQLLLKQRDIMIALTQRLNERDEQIMALQDELDAYDRHQKELEEKLDKKTAALIHLQRVAIEHESNSPTKDVELTKALGDWAKGTSEDGKRSTLLDATQLITHKQYSPFRTSRRSTAVEVGSENPEELLSAEDKILELRSLLKAQSSAQTQLEKQVGELSKEKTTLAQKLASRRESTESSGVAILKQRLNDIENENAALKAQRDDRTAESASVKAQTQMFQSKCETLVKERRAVQTIMEHKIKALVTAVAQASDSTIDRAGGIERVGDSGKWLQREVGALQRLINAAIAALNNASDTTLPPTATSSDNKIAATKSKIATSSTGKISVDKLIQQRRIQLQKNNSNNST